jgi:head-tail adaptor
VVAPAGKFRHRVTVQKPSATRAKDASGREVSSFEDVAVDVPAWIEALSGRSLVVVAQRQGEATHEVGLRYMAPFANWDGSWRVKFGNRVFVQDAPPKNPGELNRELVLTCAEGLREQ